MQQTAMAARRVDAKVVSEMFQVKTQLQSLQTSQFYMMTILLHVEKVTQ